MTYRIFLILSGKEYEIPVLPEKFKVSSPGKNEKTTVLKLGEILRLRDKGLRSFGWDSFFPLHVAPYTTATVPEPMAMVRAIQKERDKKNPIRFLMTGTDWDCNCRMGIESFDYEERSGEVGDLYYTIKLQDWKDYSPKKIILDGSSATVQEPTRPGLPDNGNSITAQEGESVWDLAQRAYGDGSQYTEILRRNPSLGGVPLLVQQGKVVMIY